MAVLLLAAMVMTAMAVPAALRIPEVRTQEIVLPGLPPALDGLRVAQLTDLHISRNFPAEWTRAVVEKTNALRPDIILLTGDLMDGSPALRREDFAPMADLRRRWASSPARATMNITPTCLPGGPSCALTASPCWRTRPWCCRCGAAT